MKHLLILLLLFMVGYSISAQRVTVSGYVADSKTGERLLNSTILAGTTGTVTNDYGFFSLTLPKGSHQVRISFVGYAPETFNLALSKDTLLQVALVPSIAIEDVVVSAKAVKALNSEGVGSYSLTSKQVNELPVLLGERDVIKAIQMLPGVQACNENSGGMIVRGGSTDGNLILLDDVPIFNVNHMFGYFSVFDSDALKSIQFYSGGYPAKFGGRNSSVLDLKLKDGNKYEYHGNVTVGLVSSKLFLEGPLKREKSSFMLSARRTYIDLPMRLYQRLDSPKSSKQRNGFYFYDIIGKMSFDLGESDRLFLTVYNGLDKTFRVNELNKEMFIDNNQLDWGNITSALRWNHQFSPKLFANTTLTHTLYQFNIDREYLKNDTTFITNSYYATTYDYGSSINDLSLKWDASYYWSPSTQVSFGAFVARKGFNAGKSDYFQNNSKESEGSRNLFEAPFRYSMEYGAYGSVKTAFLNLFYPELGARYVAYAVNGTSFQFVEPRVSLVVKPRNFPVKLNANYTVMHQNLHLLNNYGSDMPIDLWVPATEKVVPSEATQFSVGLEYQLNDAFRFSLGAYQKDLKNVITYQDGEGFSPTDMDWEAKIVQGKGRSKGIEVLAEKTMGRLTGWVSYTLSKTERQFEGINKGAWYPYTYDRKHEANVVLSYALNERVKLNAAWVYATGNAISLPQSKYYNNSYSGIIDRPDVGGMQFYPIFHYNSKNNARMPDYHRLDGGISFSKQRKHGVRTWNMGVYNMYARKNPNYLTLTRKGSMAPWEFNMNSMFRFIPYISYNYAF